MNRAANETALHLGDPYGIRTHVTAVKGRCLNRLTKGPYFVLRRYSLRSCRLLHSYIPKRFFLATSSLVLMYDCGGTRCARATSCTPTSPKDTRYRASWHFRQPHLNKFNGLSQIPYALWALCLLVAYSFGSGGRIRTNDLPGMNRPL